MNREYWRFLQKALVIIAIAMFIMTLIIIYTNTR